MPSDRILLLRAHHGMCLAYFKGLGYSGDFALGMRSVLEDLLKTNGNVRLITDADPICESCPLKRDGHCLERQRVRSYDRKVLALCGLKEGDILPFRSFAGLVQERILGCGLRKTVCSGCRWEAICSSNKSRWEAF